MSPISLGSWIFPPELAVLGLLAGALAVFLRFRKIGIALILMVLLAVVRPFFRPLVDAAIDATPLWLLIPVLFVIAILVLRTVFSLIIGKEATTEMFGSLAADAVKFLWLLPFRSVAWVVRRLLIRR
jgi:hypothetical protein